MNKNKKERGCVHQENLAARILQHQYPKSVIQRQIVQSNSEIDLLIYTNGSLTAGCEVTSITDSKCRGIYDLIDKNMFIEKKQCKSGWFLEPSPSFVLQKKNKFKDKIQEIDLHLARLEENGITKFDCNSMNSDIANDIIYRFGIVNAFTGGINHCILYPTLGGAVPKGRLNIETVNAIQKSDNIKKLSSICDINGRHFFVYIDDFLTECEFLNSDKISIDLPDESKDLVRWVWLACQRGEHVWYRKFDTQNSQSEHLKHFHSEFAVSA